LDRKYWYIKRADIFSEMSPEGMQWLAQHSVMCTFVKGAVIFLPDEPSNHVYLLKEGAIKIARLDESGRETIVELIAPGEIFGEMSLLGKESRSTMAQPMEESLICSVKKADFAEFFKSLSELTFKLLKLVGFKRIEIESRLEELAYCLVPEKIAPLR
jgi:CRP/FNR family transcriptional regulator